MKRAANICTLRSNMPIVTCDDAFRKNYNHSYNITSNYQYIDLILIHRAVFLL